MSKDPFRDALATKTRGGSSAGGSVDHAALVEEGIDMLAEGMGRIHAALDLESSADGSEPLPDEIPEELSDEYEALADAIAAFANSAADVFDEPIGVEIPDLDEE